MTKPFAAFDVDGTIFKSSLVEKVIEHGIEDELFAADMFTEAHESKRRWQNENKEDVYQEYLNRLVGSFVTQIAGVDVEHFEDVATKMIKKHEVRVFRLPRLMMRQLTGTHVPIAVSGSPDMLVRPFVARLNIASAYGSTFEVEDGKYTGNAKSVGNKALLLQKLVGQGELIQEGSIAMGDTVSDIPMLEYADHPIMFNASNALTAHGSQLGWDKAFEIKDQITILRKSYEGTSYSEIHLDEFIDSLS